MSRYWSELVGELTPYIPGEQPRQQQLLKLNTNENPYPPSPSVLEAIKGLDADILRLYPDPESSALKESFARYHSLEVEQVFLGNGSDEVLAHVFQGLLKHDQPLLLPDISYSFYPVWCDLYRIAYRKVPLADDYTVDVEDYRGDNGGIIIANPNAPTGILLPLHDIRRLLEQNPCSVVVVDEAYIDFGGASAVQLIDDYPNLLVIQTLSKSRSLAGLRIGLAMGHAKLIEALERVKNSFNSYPLGVVAQLATQASLQDEAYFRQCCERVIASRERLALELVDMGFRVLPSAANFLFVTHPEHAAKQLCEALRDQGVIVRHFCKPRISEFIRISIGTEQQCNMLVSVLGKLLSDRPN